MTPDRVPSAPPCPSRGGLAEQLRGAAALWNCWRQWRVAGELQPNYWNLAARATATVMEVAASGVI